MDEELAFDDVTGEDWEGASETDSEDLGELLMVNSVRGPAWRRIDQLRDEWALQRELSDFYDD